MTSIRKILSLLLYQNQTYDFSYRKSYTRLIFCCCFRKPSKADFTHTRQHKTPRTSTYRREFIPFLGLILIVLAILAYYLGTTQSITIRGKNGLYVTLKARLHTAKTKLVNFHISKYKATFTRDRTGTAPNRTGSDRLLFKWNLLEPVRYGSKTGPINLQV